MLYYHLRYCKTKADTILVDVILDLEFHEHAAE